MTTRFCQTSCTLVLFSLVLALVSGCAESTAPQGTDSESAEVTSDATSDVPRVAFELADADERAPSIADLAYLKGEPVAFEPGRVYLVEFWATWCGPCVANIPHLTKVQSKYKDQGVTVIGISIDKDADKLSAFMPERGQDMGYTVAHDVDQQVYNDYMAGLDGRYIPRAFLIDQQGRPAWTGLPGPEMDKVLAQIVDGSFDQVAFDAAQQAKAIAIRKADRITKDYNKALDEAQTMHDARPVARQLYALEHPVVLYEFAQYILYQEEEGPDADNSRVDFELALEFATRANADTGGQDIKALGIYTSALSRTGRFKEAIAAQEKVLTLLPADDTRRRESAQKRLAYLKKLDG